MTAQETIRLEALQAALKLSHWGSADILLQNSRRIESYLNGSDSSKVPQAR